MVRQGGAAALLPLKPGPKGPSKMTPQLEARGRSLRADGLSLRTIAAQLSTSQKSISYVTVATLFQLSEHYAIDQPEAGSARAQQIQTLQAQLGRALEDSDENQRSTVSRPQDRSCRFAAPDRATTSSPRPSGKPSAPYPQPDLRPPG